MSVRCIIVEDEPLAVARLAEYVQALPVLDLVGTFDNANDALSFLIGNPVDLLFLDITLGDMSGIEMLETTAVSAQTILTTAHSDFAVKAYDLKVADYLLKPFTFARFVQAVDRARAAGATAPNERESSAEFLFVKTEARLERVRLADVLYIEGQGDYRHIVTLQKRIVTPETFGALEERLPASRICRVHKSYMVALEKIESVERDRIVIRDKRIPVSASYRQRFYTLIGRRP
jgi:DNA-binding LytR/AlgR family response regulator